jgi:RNA polymerase I-specific transcription initiation factor RRN7
VDSQKQSQDSQNGTGEPPGASKDLPASSGKESGSDDDPDDQQLRDLMEGASDSTSEEEEGGMNLKETGNPVVRSRSKRKQHLSFDTPVANIAVLLLSCWLLRFPIICMDIVR